MDNKIENFINTIKESLNTRIVSLPDSPKELFKKIKTSFPNLSKNIKLISASIIHADILKLKCNDYILYIKRSSNDYKLLEVMAKKDGKNLFYEKSVFFEDLERVLNTKLKNGKVGVGISEEKIGSNTKDIENMATSLGSSISAVKDDENVTGEVMKNVSEKYEDFEKTVNSSRFKRKIDDIDKDLYKKIKKSLSQNK